MEILRHRLSAADARLERLRQEYEELARASPAARISATMNAVTRDLAHVSGEIAMGEEVAASEAKRAEFLRQVDALEQDIEDHDKATKRSTARLQEVQEELGTALKRWLKVLRTNPIGEIGVSKNLRVTIDGKVLTDQRGPSGSSRTRLILAYHAARLEVALGRNGCHPGILLFDAPKQHEIEPDDVERYVQELRTLANRHPRSVQVVASSRTKIPLAEGDQEWRPTFPPRIDDDHPWFLGVLEQQREDATAPQDS